MGSLWDYDFRFTDNCNVGIPPYQALSSYRREEPQKCTDGTDGIKYTVRRYSVSPGSRLYTVTSSLYFESITYSNGCQ